MYMLVTQPAKPNGVEEFDQGSSLTFPEAMTSTSGRKVSRRPTIFEIQSNFAASEGFTALTTQVE